MEKMENYIEAYIPTEDEVLMDKENDVKSITSEQLLNDIVISILESNGSYIVSSDWDEDDNAEWKRIKCNHPVINVIASYDVDGDDISDIYNIIHKYEDYIESISHSIDKNLITIRIKWNRNNVIFE